MELGLIWWLISELRSSYIDEGAWSLGKGRPKGRWGLGGFEIILG